MEPLAQLPAEYRAPPSVLWIAFVVVAVGAVALMLYPGASAPTSATVEGPGRPRCIVAQDDLHMLELGARVYVVEAGGTRAYLPEEQRSAAIDAARERVERFCGGRPRG